ncbi:MAG: branched-chain amino acid ABC transporter permease [Chloroflexi bacterium]|nr:MAG: branched-chain amino acid ABC transporter permease [Chloroflexota bacterium]
MTSRLMFRVLAALIAFTVLGRIPVGFDVGFKFDAALAVIWAFGLLSLVLLTGYVGQISLCQATFAGVGAYAAGLMVAGFHADYMVAVLVGVAAAFALGVIVGIPALRLRGITLAIVTLGIALVFDRYVFQDHAFEWFTGGSAGWRVDHATMFGLQMDSSKHLMAAYVVLLALFCVGHPRLRGGSGDDGGQPDALQAAGVRHVRGDRRPRRFVLPAGRGLGQPAAVLAFHLAPIRSDRGVDGGPVRPGRRTRRRVHGGGPRRPDPFRPWDLHGPRVRDLL